MTRAPHLVHAALTDALALAFPVRCAGCDADGVALCDGCRGALTPRPSRRTVGDLEVHSGLAFDGVAARVLRALKEDGRTGLARALAPALAAAASPFPGALVVPVPSSRGAYRRRGYRPAELLAARAGLRPARRLRAVRVVADQRGLGRGERAANVAGSLCARGVAGLAVVVVDDVLTTGATLGEAARALRAAGADVVAAATVAATPRRGHAAD